MGWDIGAAGRETWHGWTIGLIGSPWHAHPLLKGSNELQNSSKLCSGTYFLAPPLEKHNRSLRNLPALLIFCIKTWPFNLNVATCHLYPFIFGASAPNCHFKCNVNSRMKRAGWRLEFGTLGRTVPGAAKAARGLSSLCNLIRLSPIKRHLCTRDPK